MRKFILPLCLWLFISGCHTSDVNFSQFKIFNSQYDVALETSEKVVISELNSLFNDRIVDNQKAPNFRYLIEITTSNGTERWRYSSDGYLQKYSQEDQTIYALIYKDKFNKLAQINP